jgi:hypothetical protein
VISGADNLVVDGDVAFGDDVPGIGVGVGEKLGADRRSAGFEPS